MKTFTRKNVGGLIFSSKDAFRSVEAWFEAKAPSGSLIYDTPGNLIRAGLTIVDAQKVDGVYYRFRNKVPKVSKITRPQNVNKIVDLQDTPAQVFPGLIFFDINNKKHKPRNIGTTGPSKITREAKAKEAKPKVAK